MVGKASLSRRLHRLSRRLDRLSRRLDCLLRRLGRLLRRLGCLSRRLTHLLRRPGSLIYIDFLISYRFPLPLCKKLGKTTAKYRWFALVYIVAMFVIIPLTLVGLSAIGNSVLYTFLGLVAFLVVLVVLVNLMQSKCPGKLPKSLQEWPYWLKSLEPYDRYPFFQKPFLKLRRLNGL